MADINPALSVITLNIKDSNSSIQRDRQNGFKKIIQLYTVYKSL